RSRRALTIMGRKEEEADLDASKLIYPAMQVADIHWMDLDLALGGMDQRHAHMLYRDVAPKLGWKQVVALHTPLLPALDGGGRMDLVAGKMSKSRPDASILLNDGPREVERKIGKAFCPAKEPVGNPVLEIARLILFPRRGKLMIPRDPKFGGDVGARQRVAPRQRLDRRTAGEPLLRPPRGHLWDEAVPHHPGVRLRGPRLSRWGRGSPGRLSNLDRPRPNRTDADLDRLRCRILHPVVFRRLEPPTGRILSPLERPPDRARDRDRNRRAILGQ